jgi:formylglycine-generating enzyme required for sulfatase activity
MGKLLLFLVLACIVQVAGAQSLFKGFIPDENGTNLDAPQASKAVQQKVAPGTIIKDCAECPEMVVIPAGSFVMGSNKSSDEQPTHSVNLRSFLIGKTEVTQEQWEAVMGYNRTTKKGLTLPVVQVTWDEIQQFIAKLNQKTGQKYRLPSESEWEYAARAGTTTEWSFGDDESKLGNYAWFARNSGGTTQPVGQKLPNAFGLFDMHGNVWEWTQDCQHNTYAGAPTDGSAWTTGCLNTLRVLRGGSWVSSPSVLRSAYRGKSNPDGRYFTGQNLPGNPSDDDGFRLARDL